VTTSAGSPIGTRGFRVIGHRPHCTSCRAAGALEPVFAGQTRPPEGRQGLLNEFKKTEEMVKQVRKDGDTMQREAGHFFFLRRRPWHWPSFRAIIT
jgi:hypothetical protein